mmetsp:Transcript_7047/g.11491  ORF Transcript_7047/g.11491 Transcript_7047/m.11491 type:complete len:85 (-) Transcript_7047:37-291(-)
MIAKKIYVGIVLGVIAGFIVGNQVSQHCCIDKGGNEALGILIGCLSGVGVTILLYIISTESQRNCCSGCSKLLHRVVDDDDDYV